MTLPDVFPQHLGHLSNSSRRQEEKTKNFVWSSIGLCLNEKKIMSVKIKLINGPTVFTFILSLVNFDIGKLSFLNEVWMTDRQTNSIENVCL